MSTRHTIYHNVHIHLYREMESVRINDDRDLKDFPLCVDSEVDLAFIIMGDDTERHLFVYEIVKGRRHSFARIVKNKYGIGFLGVSYHKYPYLVPLAAHIFEHLPDNTWLFSDNVSDEVIEKLSKV